MAIRKTMDHIVELSGLPEESTRLRLQKLLHEGGFDPNEAGLEEIREVLSNLLQDLILATESDSQ